MFQLSVILCSKTEGDVTSTDRMTGHEYHSVYKGENGEFRKKETLIELVYWFMHQVPVKGNVCRGSIFT